MFWPLEQPSACSEWTCEVLETIITRIICWALLLIWWNFSLLYCSCMPNRLECTSHQFACCSVALAGSVSAESCGASRSCLCGINQEGRSTSSRLHRCRSLYTGDLRLLTYCWLTSPQRGFSYTYVGLVWFGAIILALEENLFRIKDWMKFICKIFLGMDVNFRDESNDVN